MRQSNCILAFFSILRLLQASSTSNEAKKESIPRKLWLDVHNIPGRESDEDKLYNENMANVIQKYEASWDNDDSVEVNTLTTSACGKAIKQIPIKDASTTLFEYFMEKDPHRHICKIAVLFLYGGYYITRSVDLIEPYIAPAEISFVGVTSDPTTFNESFLASSSYSSLLYRALKKYVMLAKGELDLKTESVFREIMHSSYIEMTTVNPEHKSTIALLSVQDLNKLHNRDDEYKKVSKQDAEGTHCNQVVVDHEKSKVYFHLFIPDAVKSKCKKLVRQSTEVVPKVDTSHHAKIPHKLWFLSKHRSVRGQLRTTVERHDNNVKKTLKAYQDLWDNDFIQFKILDDEVCMHAILNSHLVKSSKTLTDFFKHKIPDIFDFCRAVISYEHGGYFINEEVEVIEPYSATDDDTSFVGVLNTGGNILPSFFAVARQHPISYEIMMKYVKFAEGKLPLDVHYPAFKIYGDSYNDLKDDIKSKSVMLREKNLEDISNKNGLKSKDEHICNFVITDPDKGTIHFFTRIFSNGSFCVDKED